MAATPSIEYNITMAETTPLFFIDAAEWQNWLAANHRDATEAWVVHRKAKSSKPGLRYPEALEEALCFGWIDGKLKSIDETSFMLRYSPRKANSVWSRPNKEKAEELIRTGRMTDAGLAAVAAAKKSGNWYQAYTDQEAFETPEDLRTALASNPAAAANFARFAVSSRNYYIRWIDQAKAPAKRLERISEVVKRSENNLKPGTSSLS